MNRKLTLMLAFALLCVRSLFAAAPALAESSPVPQNIYQEAQRIAAELRCPVCTGQSLVESNSEVAQEMRDKIVEMLRQGKTRPEILEYFVGQYGDWILNSPPVRGAGLLVWIVPPAALILGGGILVWFFRRRRSPSHGTDNGPSPGPDSPPRPGGGTDQDADIRRKVQDHLRDYL